MHSRSAQPIASYSYINIIYYLLSSERSRVVQKAQNLHKVPPSTNYTHIDLTNYNYIHINRLHTTTKQ